METFVAQKIAALAGFLESIQVAGDAPSESTRKP